MWSLSPVFDHPKSGATAVNAKKLAARDTHRGEQARRRARHNWKNIKKQLPWRDLSIGPLIARCAYRARRHSTRRHLNPFARLLPRSHSSSLNNIYIFMKL
jgi:hypothetical protein